MQLSLVSRHPAKNNLKNAVGLPQQSISYIYMCVKIYISQKNEYMYI